MGYFEDKAIISISCPICGKSFVPAPMHIYRDKRCHKRVCSWSCVCKSERAMGDVKTNIDTGVQKRIYRERKDAK